MDPLIARQRLLAARDLLRFNIEVAKLCHSFGGVFVWEHPQSACSWKEPEVVQYLQGDLVSEVVFDQCRVGLLSKVGLLPMRKATRLAGTAIHVLDLFRGMRCQCEMPHQVIIGTEGGCKRSEWAQYYPPLMCKLFAKGVWLHCNGAILR